MRQRFLTSGLDAFEDHEILEMLLFYAIPRKNTNLIAHQLIDDYGSLSAVLNASADDLMTRHGIGENAAVLLSLLTPVVRRIQVSALGVELSSLKNVGKYLVELFRGVQVECFYQLCFNRKKKMLLCKKLDTGSLSSSRVDIRALLQNALLPGVDSVVISHNHPDGDAMPSPEDYAATERVREALKYIDVDLWDHIIVSGERYASLRRSGYFSM